MLDGKFNKVADRMREIRSFDLNLVDRSDFIVAHLIPDVASWGSAEELVTAIRMKKPVFLSIEGGKKKTPLWIMGMLPHKYIYNNVTEIVDKLKNIDSGKKAIDNERWRLLKKELR
jgi:nucleoside 2-deoxyribosyltransferase